MLVFLSWSGESSRSAATALRDWLPNVIQAVDPWMSAKDIDKGARWSTDIAQYLEKAQVGILCLTPENQNAPWILFEAGALSKALGRSFVCPYLLGLQPTDLQGPLVQFQATEASKSDTFRLLQTINTALASEGLPEANLQRVFDKWWPDLRAELNKINLEATPKKSRRSERELIEETLSLVRQLAKDQQLQTVTWISPPGASPVGAEAFGVAVAPQGGRLAAVGSIQPGPIVIGQQVQPLPAPVITLADVLAPVPETSETPKTKTRSEK